MDNLDNDNEKPYEWSEIVSQAPGKFIISGEYSVVFGKPAIAAAIDAKTTATIRRGSGDSVILRLNDLGCSIEWKVSVLQNLRLLISPTKVLIFQDKFVAVIEQYIQKYSTITYDPDLVKIESKEEPDKKVHDSSIAFLLIYLGIGDCFGGHKRHSINVSIDSKIPVGSGLGSSSSYSISLIGAMNCLYKANLDTEAINEWAFNIDKYFHGNPSGVDNSVITYGGYILFERGIIKGRASQNPSIEVMLIDTGVSRSTKTFGAKLRLEREKYPTRTDNIFNEISDLTMLIWNKMIDDVDDEFRFDPSNIIDNLSSNHKLLEELGVGHDKLTDIKQISEEFGFFAKLTGAGCGGGAFVLYKPDRDLDNIEKFQQKLAQSGYNVRRCQVGCDGLSVSINGNRTKAL